MSFVGAAMKLMDRGERPEGHGNEPSWMRESGLVVRGTHGRVTGPRLRAVRLGFVVVGET